MVEIIDGKAAAAELHAELAREAERLRARGVIPRLEVVLVGDDPASHSYVRGKVNTATRLGILSHDHLLPASATQEEVEALVSALNADPAVHGILLQSPFPSHLDYEAALLKVDPDRDVDGLHPMNAGRLMAGRCELPPCTPAGIIHLLKRHGAGLEGEEAVVVGRSLLVGKPVAQLLLGENCTVTMAHSRTVDLPAVCRRASILIAAVGRPGLITGDYIREGAIVIDVGITRVEGRLRGDVEWDSACRRASAITPAPGGVGPMTVAMLMRNTLRAAFAAAERGMTG